MKYLFVLILLFSFANSEAMDNFCNGAPTTIQANGGGKVALTALVDASVYVGPSAAVCEYAIVTGSAQIKDSVLVYGQAQVNDGTIIAGSVEVFGNSMLISNYPNIVNVYDSAKIYGNASVVDGATVRGSAKIYENAHISSTATVGDAAKVFGSATVTDTASVSGVAKIHGDAFISSNVVVNGTSNLCKKKNYSDDTVLTNVHECSDTDSDSNTGSGSDSGTGDVITSMTLSSSGNHICYLRQNGTLQCWGNNGSGQLGYGNTNSIGDDEFPSSVGNVPVNAKVLQVSTGDANTCVVVVGGKVRCWGYNGGGELGYGSAGGIRTSPGPDIDVGGNAIQVSVTGGHACVLLDTGAVKCWGSNMYGELGYGDVIPRYTPGPAINIGGPAKYVFAMSTHTCVILRTGAVKCWGQNSQGQLGDGTQINIPAPGNAIDVGEEVVQLTGGIKHTCAVLKSGGMSCWGENTNNILGFGDTGKVYPRPINPIFLESSINQISTSGIHSCVVVSSGRLKCWGLNQYGEQGYGDTVGRVSPGENVNINEYVKQVATGQNHTCALMGSGYIRCWGAGSAFLGYGNTTQLLSPGGYVPVNVKGFSNNKN